jgi:hypothetical protein
MKSLPSAAPPTRTLGSGWMKSKPSTTTCAIWTATQCRIGCSCSRSLGIFPQTANGATSSPAYVTGLESTMPTNPTSSPSPPLNSSPAFVMNLGSAIRAAHSQTHTCSQRGPLKRRGPQSALVQRNPPRQLQPHQPNAYAHPTTKHAPTPTAPAKGATRSRNAWRTVGAARASIPSGGGAPGTYISPLTNAARLTTSRRLLTLHTTNRVRRPSPPCIMRSTQAAPLAGKPIARSIHHRQQGPYQRHHCKQNSSP